MGHIMGAQPRMCPEAGYKKSLVAEGLFFAKICWYAIIE
jgi:hypothetical protein